MNGAGIKMHLHRAEPKNVTCILGREAFNRISSDTTTGLHVGESVA